MWSIKSNSVESLGSVNFYKFAERLKIVRNCGEPFRCCDKFFFCINRKVTNSFASMSVVLLFAVFPFTFLLLVRKNI